MDLPAHIRECLAQSQLHHKLAPTSFKMYRWHLHTFAAWLKDQGVEVVAAPAIVAFMDYLQRPKAEGGRGFKPRSTRAAWVAVCFFAHWMEESGRLPGSVIPRYPLPRLQDAEVHVLSTADASRLARAAAESKISDPFRSALASALFFVLATGALRNQEVRNLLLSHYHAPERELRVVGGKGGKNRTVHLSYDCAQAIDAWLQVRPKGTCHTFLFCQNDKIRRLGDNGLKSLLRSLAEAAGLDYAKSHRPHAMRRGCATRLLEAGENIDNIRSRLGHKNITTTQIYLRVEEAALRSTRDLAALLPPEPESVKAPVAPEPVPPVVPGPAAPEAKQGKGNGERVKVKEEDPRRHRKRLHAQVRRRQSPE